MVKVSVIIPAYNCASFLDDAVKSVLSQEYSPLELVVVNDGSTDRTSAVIGAYLKDPRVKYAEKKDRQGLSAARNTGSALSDGELIAFLDADDIFLPGKIARQAALMSSRNGLISYTNEIYFCQDPYKEIASARYHFDGDVFYFLKRSNFVHISTVMVRRGLLNELPFNGSLESHEDWEWLLRIAEKDACFYYDEEPLSKIRVRQSSMTWNTETMDRSRHEVGCRARDAWKELKNRRTPFTFNGRRAIIRYAFSKTKAFFMGFPGREAFNNPVPQSLLFEQ